MRQVTLGLWTGLFLFAWAGLAQAQSVATAPVIDYPAPFVLGSGPGAADRLPVAMPIYHAWSVDVELGEPSGLRIQHSLGDNIGRDWLVEGFVGVEFIFPMAGGGLRRRFSLVFGDYDTFQIRPGVDAYLLYNTLRDIYWFRNSPHTFGLVTGDVDLLWQHVMSDHCSGMFGVKLGVGSAGHGFLPIGSVVFGIQF